MFDYYNSTRSERQLKSLTGLGKKQFEELLLAFSESLTEISDEAYRKNRTKRSRRPGGGDPDNYSALRTSGFLSFST